MLFPNDEDSRSKQQRNHTALSMALSARILIRAIMAARKEKRAAVLLEEHLLPLRGMHPLTPDEVLVLDSPSYEEQLFWIEIMASMGDRIPSREDLAFVQDATWPFPEQEPIMQTLTTFLGYVESYALGICSEGVLA